jgi:hypothetical protein
MDRGDRVSIQGDGHPTMAAGLAAFGSPATYDLVYTMLNKTDSGCDGCHVVDDTIMPYPVYWTMSVNDWFWASANSTGYMSLAPDMANILEKDVATFLQKGLNVAWFGWDDRVGNGFCGTCNTEAQLGFATLLVRACSDFANALAHITPSTPQSKAMSMKFNATATKLAARLRSGEGPGDGHVVTTEAGLPRGAVSAWTLPSVGTTIDFAASSPPSSSSSVSASSAPSLSASPWYAPYGLHAAANAINARIPSDAAELEAIFALQFNDSTTLCSWSNFNQFWILQALGNMGKMDYALASIHLCWAPMTTLGKGCFWELFSPEWTRFMEPGDKAPTRPSYCHPWSDGVTAWLTNTAAGLVPLLPGYAQFAVLPHISEQQSSLDVELPTPNGVIGLKTMLTHHNDSTGSTGNTTAEIRVSFTASFAKQQGAPGPMTKGLPQLAVIGLQAVNEYGCTLRAVSTKTRGATGSSTQPQTKQLKLLSAADLHHHSLSSGLGVAHTLGDLVNAKLHPAVVGRHMFVSARQLDLQTKAVTVVGEYGCPTTTGAHANNNNEDEEDTQLLARKQAAEKDYPPLPPPHYSGSWEVDNSTRGDW